MAAADGDDSLYPIAVLIDELRNEDVQVPRGGSRNSIPGPGTAPGPDPPGRNGGPEGAGGRRRFAARSSLRPYGGADERRARICSRRPFIL